MIYYKATRPDGTDFHTSTVHYEVGQTIVHPLPWRHNPVGYFSVSTVPTDCTSCEWPLRLFEVEADEVWTAPRMPNKRCTHSLRVVREVDATLALGPQGPEITALLERCETLTRAELRELIVFRTLSAMDASRAAATSASREAAWEAVWKAAWDAVPDATWVVSTTAISLLVRDLIGTDFTQEQYDTLTEPWRKVIGPIHPDDPILEEEES